MKKFLPAIVLLAPFWLAACADEGETVVVQPPPQQSGTVVVPEERRAPNTVVVPRDNDGVKVCPEGSVC